MWLKIWMKDVKVVVNQGENKNENGTLKKVDIGVNSGTEIKTVFNILSLGTTFRITELM